MLDPHNLRVFLVAAETLNFSRTAQRLHMSQPSVSQHIRLLETHLKSPLFIRSGRTLSLSETGQALVPLARRLVSLALETDEKINALRDDVHGELIISCSSTPGKYILPLLLAEFMRLHPNVQARCESHSRARALELLEQGTVQLCLLSLTTEMAQTVEFRKLSSDPIVLIAPLDHPWAQREEIEPHELLEARFILREDSACAYRQTRKALAKVGVHIEDLQTILTLGNSEAIAISVQNGVGMGFISRMVLRHMAQGKVAEVKVRGVEIAQHIYLCRHRLRPSGRLPAAFWSFAAQSEWG